MTAVLTFCDLPLHAFHQHYKFFRLVISLCLLAHLLKILRSVRNTIRHGGLFLVPEARIAYPIAGRLPSPQNFGPLFDVFWPSGVDDLAAGVQLLRYQG